MTVGQWVLRAEATGTVVVIAMRLIARERPTWRYAFSFIWPLIVLIFAVELLAKLVGHKFIGDENWDKFAGFRGEASDGGQCPVCQGNEVVPFDELEERARAVIDGESEDLAADCKLFAPIVLHFVKKHRWDRSRRNEP